MSTVYILKGVFYVSYRISSAGLNLVAEVTVAWTVAVAVVSSVEDFCPARHCPLTSTWYLFHVVNSRQRTLTKYLSTTPTHPLREPRSKDVSSKDVSPHLCHWWS